MTADAAPAPDPSPRRASAPPTGRAAAVGTAPGAGTPTRSDAAWVAALVALDPTGLGGVVVRASAGEARDAWLACLVASMPQGAPVRRIPLHVDDDRLLGGLDLAGSLQAGRVVAERGLLAAADRGLVVLAMAERIAPGTAARIAAALDTGELVVERAGSAGRAPARLGVVALDEGIGDDEGLPARLAERLAFRIETAAVDGGDGEPVAPGLVAAARERLARVEADHAVVESLCAAALALGAGSVRAPLFALRAARGVAALAGRSSVTADDAALAARLVLAHRATRLPADGAAAPSTDASENEPPMPQPPDTDATHPSQGAAAADDVAQDGAPAHGSPSDAAPAERTADGDPPARVPPANDRPSAADESRRAPADADRVLAAALAALPPHLLDALQRLPAGATRQAPIGRSGALLHGTLRGRPLGVRRAVPRGGARLAVLETLRAAAPWQRLRREAADAEAAGRPATADAGGRPRREPADTVSPSTRHGAGAPTRSDAAGTAPPRAVLHVRREDFHVRRHALRRETTTVFVVDASGSSALHRLAEAKGAVELLLADCYVRRDSVALIAFRGAGADLLLPPTRSLARAKRSLAGLPGGGGTPLAAGLDAAAALVETLRRRGVTPFVVLLTDGRGNIARDGTPGRPAALRDALAASQRLRATGVATLLLDTSPQPQGAAARIAEALAARYLPLPHAGARDMSAAVRGASPPRR